MEKALHAAERIKVGASRSEVERDFILDGGVTFRDESVYTFRNCPYLKLKIRFDRDKSKQSDLTMNDIVATISRLYVEWPHGD